SQYYRDDPRAQEPFTTEPAPAAPAPAPAPNQTMADPVSQTEELKSESKSSDFAEATTVNMWDNIRTDNGGDDGDIPAILRRRKKNKD
ncbi:hypothetical protein J6X09_02010, partial [Candidatus Saccharibacteria bacterium]|nr:hypothetical protein [Candidatus Saccharibacteria bacterium]